MKYFCYFSSFYVVPRTTQHTGHHEPFEGVIYDSASSSSGHAKFYIRHKNVAFHHEFLVVQDHADYIVSESGHLRSRRWEVLGADITDIPHAHLEAHYEL